MSGSGESAALVAQRAAIQEARARYERGELSYEAFRRALDAIVMARDAEECQTILRALPISPLAPLSALEQPNLLAPASTLAPRHGRIVAFMSQVKKLRRPWQLQPSTHAVAVMGELKLNLHLAEIPPRAKLRVTAVMGSVTILVPPTAQVSVRTTVVMSDTRALGEGVTGMVAFGHEQYAPAPGAARTYLEIEVFSFMSNVKVALASNAPVSISELVRDALQAAATGIQRGLRQGTGQYPSLGPGGHFDTQGRAGE